MLLDAVQRTLPRVTSDECELKSTFVLAKISMDPFVSFLSFLHSIILIPSFLNRGRAATLERLKLWGCFDFRD